MTNVVALYPEPGPARQLKGLYLETDLREIVPSGKPFVFTNFVTSLDGRISVRTAGTWQIPPQIKTSQDLRLYQELSAQADVIIITARHARALLHNEELQPFPFTGNTRENDLRQWRLQHGRSELPAIAVVCRTLNFSGEALRKKLGCPVYCVTGSDASPDAINRMQEEGVSVAVASDTALVPGARVINALAEQGFDLIYSVAGPVLMNALLKDKVLNRLYLSQVEQFAGGEEFRTFFDSAMPPAVSPELNSLSRYSNGKGPGQMFAVYDLVYPR